MGNTNNHSFFFFLNSEIWFPTPWRLVAVVVFTGIITLIATTTDTDGSVVSVGAATSEDCVRDLVLH